MDAPTGPPPHSKYRIDGIQKGLRMAERLKNNEVFNWAEILRSAEEIIKNAPKDPASQEAARKRYLEVLADMDVDEVPAALRPMIASAQAILEGDDLDDETRTLNKAACTGTCRIGSE